MKLQFSGHDSFICKHFWLKKGYDFINHEGSFNNESAVIDLGVENKMVTAINYWLKAFRINENSGGRSDIRNIYFLKNLDCNRKTHLRND